MENNVDALKALAVKVTGKSLSEITGTTIAEVIQFIADNYPANSGS